MSVEIIPSEFTVLIVDDIKSNIILLQALLRRAGYKTISAMSGPEALEVMSDKHPDLVLLDVMMPDMDGYEVAERAKADPAIKDIPIIFVTALADPEAVVAGFKKGGNDFISKPFNQEEIMIRINHQLSLVASMRTINSQKKELEQVIADRQQLYAVVAHDLRSPLGIIKTTLNMLTESLSPATIDPDLYELVVATNQSGEELFALLDNLLNWARYQMGRIAYNPEVFKLSEAAKDGVHACDMIAKANNIKINLDLECDSIVNADVKMSSTIVRNFITNAIKYTEDGGSIDVRLRCDEQYSYIDVIDYGIGISEENQEALRSNLSITTTSLRNEEGNGLGLTLCRDFALKNGGKMTFVSEENKGSTFTYILPKFIGE